MKTLIELEGVTKRYGEVTALDDVSLKIEEKGIFTVLGPNGSGKTTMLRIMASIVKPTRGDVFFGGDKINDRNRSIVRKRSTMVFQKTALFNTTVYKNVAYGLKLRGYSKKEIDEKVREALGLVQLRGYEKRSAKKLSGGEKQRVSLARALVLRANLLLLDEPTANLDPRSVSVIEETISRVNREYDTTIVIATHNMFQAETLANVAALLIDGKITQVGTPQEVFRKPSEYLTSFARLENVFSGNSTVLEGGTSMIDIGNGLTIEAAIRRKGKIMLYVRPEDIILSKRRLTSSARNAFKGKIVEILDFGSVVKLKVDIGKPVTVQITRRSFNEMKLNLNAEVFLAFKASSVRTI